MHLLVICLPPLIGYKAKLQESFQGCVAALVANQQLLPSSQWHSFALQDAAKTPTDILWVRL
jgi:hypothetical protein